MVTVTESISSMDLHRPASPLSQHQDLPSASGLINNATHVKLQSSEHISNHRHHHQHLSHHNHHHHMISSAPQKLKRVDTLDLKSKLAAALGNNGKRYWAALVDFLRGRIDRIEFEQEAALVLKSHYVHLHNSLVLALLYNASVDVPGPSSPRVGHGHLKRSADGTLVGLDGEDPSLTDDDQQDDPEHRILAPPDKRMRLLAAGLSRKDRVRIKNIPKAMSHSRNSTSGATSSLGWAGAGADMLEKKRKEEERRRTIDEKKRVKEVYTQIGAKDWKTDFLQSSTQITSVHERLSLPIQQEIARAQAALLCVESKQLPDLESMRDVMTLHAVEAGLPRGAQLQAAALLLAAVQNHLQNVTSSIITKVRANRQMGIRTSSHLLRAASDDLYQLSPLASAAQIQAVDEQEHDSFDASVQRSPTSKSHRMLASDLPMSLTSSSASLDYAGTSASASLANSSMISLVSTAPTSIHPGSASSEEVGQGEGARKSREQDEDEEGEEEERDQMRSLASSDQRRETSIAGDNSSLEVRHLSFLLNVAPHTVVEPLGLGTQERLLAPDFTIADEDAIREQEWTNEGMLLRESKIAATSKMSSIPSSTIPQQRSNYIIDQLAPVRLFDRRTLAETQALHNNRSTKSGLSLPSTSSATAKAQALEGEGEENKSSILSTFPTRNYTSGHHHHRGLDPHLYDVVDPVALLGSLVN